MIRKGKFDDVYEIVKMVPQGRVTTYGAIAQYLGMKSGARLVGWAMNNSHGLDVPAHRVVNHSGLLTGKHHFGGPDTMKCLLEAEGIRIVNDQVQDFSKKFWDPNEELL